MKARIKATGEIVRVLQTSNGDYEEFVTHNLYCPDELVFDVTDKDAIYNKGWQDGWDEAVKSEIPKIHPKLKGLDPDYWDRLTHQAAITAMQGIMSNPVGFESIRCTSKDHDKKVAEIAICFARELIEGLKLIRSN